MSDLALWGGIECTVNRVEEAWFDQIVRTGHEHRMEDLDRIAELGIKTIRYPVLWERIAPEGISKANWDWMDARLNRLRELGITPIAGLVHHGSGPAYTSLTDPGFASKLVEFATAVAKRYPWIQYFTPVNEPLTTARFSCLYGKWYPHAKNDSLFAKAFLNQCKAIIEAMKAIKEINPKALLVQTEDLGKTFSSAKLAYQTRFENQRRWLTFDMLSGKFGPRHPLWKYFLWAGCKKKELQYFTTNFYKPDVIGVNYYITSERFLDVRLKKYPAALHGGNGTHRYVDIEAVRVRKSGVLGLGGILKEVAKRYQNTNIAVTEVHLGCTHDEQIRWLNEAWQTCTMLKDKGIPIKAITAWSLLGAYNWNVLLTHENQHYESGAFDVRSKIPRITALGKFIKTLTSSAAFEPELLKMDGWWKRQSRLLFGQPQVKNLPALENKIRPLLITGATGTLGKAFARICEIRNIPYHSVSREEMDITDGYAIQTVLNTLSPWAVINAAGYVRVDDAERQKDICMMENSHGPSCLATICKEREIDFVTFSSDLVFDGKSTTPYVESQKTRPLNIYGYSKKKAEENILRIYPKALIIRTSAFFGPWDEYNFVTNALKLINKGEPFMASSENVVSPTYVPDLVNATLDLLIDGESGIWHLSNPSEITWSDFAIETAKMAGMDYSLVKPCSFNEINALAGRPLYSALGSERGLLLPPLHQAIERYVRECKLI